MKKYKLIFTTFAFLLLSIPLFFQNCTQINVTGLSSEDPLDPPEDEETPPIVIPNAVPNLSPSAPPAGSRVAVVSDSPAAMEYYPALVNADGCLNLILRQHFGDVPLINFFGQDPVYSIKMVIKNEPFITHFDGGNGTNLFTWISRAPADFENVRNVPNCYARISDLSVDFRWTNMFPFPEQSPGLEPCYVYPGETYYLNFTNKWVDENHGTTGGLSDLNPLNPAYNTILSRGEIGDLSPNFDMVADIRCLNY